MIGRVRPATLPSVVLTCIALLAADPSFAQVRDSTIDAASISPRGALWRAAVLPGWGQAYNGQFVKLPFVYAALGGLAATAVVLNDRYLLYRHAYQFKAFEEITPEGEPNPRQSFEADYLRLLDRLGLTSLPSSAIRPTRNSLRRNRDLTILGIGVVYGLSILDAYVSAHLADFDISEDLTVSVFPTVGGVRTSVRVSL